jgi:hypothetical protein
MSPSTTANVGFEIISAKDFARVSKRYRCDLSMEFREIREGLGEINELLKEIRRTNNEILALIEQQQRLADELCTKIDRTCELLLLRLESRRKIFTKIEGCLQRSRENLEENNARFDRWQRENSDRMKQNPMLVSLTLHIIQRFLTWLRPRRS